MERRPGALRGEHVRGAGVHHGRAGVRASREKLLCLLHKTQCLRGVFQSASERKPFPGMQFIRKNLRPGSVFSHPAAGSQEDHGDGIRLKGVTNPWRRLPAMDPSVMTLAQLINWPRYQELNFEYAEWLTAAGLTPPPWTEGTRQSEYILKSWIPWYLDHSGEPTSSSITNLSAAVLPGREVLLFSALTSLTCTTRKAQRPGSPIPLAAKDLHYE
uniref:ORF26 n=1 Tax=Latid herpesvirus 1 TaxID=3096545 RepID=A0AB33V6V0_9VIRU